MADEKELNINESQKSIQEKAEQRRKQIEEKLHPKDEQQAEKTLSEPKSVHETEPVHETLKTEGIKTEEKNEPEFKLPPRTEEHLLAAKSLHEMLHSNQDEIESEITTKSPETEPKLTITIDTDKSEKTDKPADTVKPVSVESVEPDTDFNPAITDFDLHLFTNGTYYKIYEKFGAQLCKINSIQGVQFTTWAPNAESVSIIGEFNGWHEGINEMQRLSESGVWSGFVSALKEGDTYKFSINSKVDGQQRRKIDPYAFRSEHRPKDASIIHNINKYKWNDAEWLAERKSRSYKHVPMNIYELHLGSWKRDYNDKVFPNEWGYMSYGQLAVEIVDYAKKMGYTHIEVMPVMEHPLDISWGYQVTHYFAPTSRYGEPEDFMYFVDLCHQNNIGVILDWVPAHFPSDDHALSFFDGKQIYAYESWKKGFHKDWNTYVFDYSSAQVRNFLISSALFWLEKYHADGLRVDAVASMLYLDYSREHGEWEPNIHGGRENLEAIEFLKHLNDVVHKYYPDTVTIAEESTSWPGVSHTVAEGGLGFDMKWNMGWMNDILLYFSKDPIHRRFHQGKITFSLWYAFSENFVLPVSHDEVVHGKKSLLEKMPGDSWQRFANMRLFMGFMFGHPGKKLNFMTNDIAQYNEWDSEQSLEWGLLNMVEMNKKFNRYAQDLYYLYTSHRALYEDDFKSDGFQWVDFSDALNSVLSFYRISKDKKQILLFTFNMTPTVHYNYIVGVPEPGMWKEIFNSDADEYGGSGIGNMGGMESGQKPYKNWGHSIKVTLPPLAVNIYEWNSSTPQASIAPGIANVEDYYVDTDTEGGG